MKDWQRVVKALESFYAARGRRFPWRYTKDPYKIFVAEVMLQKTPADRCVDVYTEFLKAFPTCKALAGAPEEFLRSFFHKLGLSKRALWLKDACTTITKALDGEVPVDEEELKKLKGVGDYTARAVVIAVNGSGRVAVDSNVRRVLTRLGVPEEEWDYLRVSKEAFYGLIDIAALFCKPRDPDCRACPLNTLCRSRNF